LLGEILTTRELPLDTPPAIELARKTTAGGCGPCNLCQVACPTGALDRAYSLDANRCLSYWTIEHRGTIPLEFWPHLAKYYFGCDLCQLACPYNRKGTVGRAPAFLEERKLPSLFATATMSARDYEKWFGGTPLTRARRGGLRRNALIALAVTRDLRLNEALALAERDPEAPVGETIAQIRAYVSASPAHD
jgi:epoxyqueuosine reductase